jgi:hypothetical protein
MYTAATQIVNAQYSIRRFHHDTAKTIPNNEFCRGGIWADAGNSVDRIRGNDV